MLTKERLQAKSNRCNANSRKRQVCHSPTCCRHRSSRGCFKNKTSYLTIASIRRASPWRCCFRSATMPIPRSVKPSLYRRRWDGELHLRSVKSVLQMDVLRAKTPEMVRKENWAHLLAYNLVRKGMAQAAEAFQLKPWKISFKAALPTLRAFALPLLTCARRTLPDLIEEMLLTIARHQTGNRPGRVEPRALKRRPKPYDLRTKPREQARKLEIKNGCE